MDTHQAINPTTNPYAVVTIPPIGRLLAALQRMAAEHDTQTIPIHMGELATAAQLASSRRVWPLLNQLAEDGHVTLNATRQTVTLRWAEVRS